MRRVALPLLLAAAAAAQEPGPIDPAEIPLSPLEIVARPGDARKALATFLEGHTLHKAGRPAEAARRYVEFLGMPGAEELPARYRRTARTRLERIDADARKRYEAAAALYAKDRAKGLAVLRALAKELAGLPAGAAARALADSDELRAAVEQARALAARGARGDAARRLESAVRTFEASLWRYEAKRLLIDLGGPDLRTPEERGESETPERGGDAENEGETEIEISDD